MKNILQKLKILILMPALVAGIIVMACGFSLKGALPKGVTVNGLDVGGMNRGEAASLIRSGVEKNLKSKSLEVRAKENVYTFKYPEINYRDDLFYILKTAQKNTDYTVNVGYYLCGLNEIAADICRGESLSALPARAKFNARGEPFTYTEGRDGAEADRKRLIADIKQSLCGGFEPVTLRYTAVKCPKSVDEVKAETKLLSSFTTHFDSSNLNRTSNIRLAAAKLNGRTIAAGETLSFNDTVGARVKERGFLSAKIIENGEFTEGVGGGVCQVSTTLYNAALLAGMKIEEYHPHSLAVSYVPPSRDAMVSGSVYDLKIKNTAKTPVYIRAETQDGSVTFRLYGPSDGAEYSLSSEVTGSIPAAEEHTEDPDKARTGKDGTVSEGYLTVKRNGYSQKVLLRRDKYQPVKRVVYDGGEDTLPKEEKAVPEDDPQG